MANQRKHPEKEQSQRVTGHSQVKNRAPDKEKMTGVGIESKKCSRGSH